MSTTITVRADASLKLALEERADIEGKSISELVREILREALEERPLAKRIGHLRGSLTIDAAAHTWRMRLRERNWRG